MSVIMIVEDDNSLREALDDTLQLAGYDTVCVEDGKKAALALSRKLPDLVLSDVQMAGMDGLQLLEKIQAKAPSLPVILMTAHAKVSDAVAAMRTGAIDYLTKPFSPEALVTKIKRCLPGDIVEQAQPIANDAKSQELLAIAHRVAQTDATVLISGESGTGKEVMARYIHDYSQRKDKPFIAVNCAAIPENMLEATLFGYEKGAFTGAYKSMPGKFEQAQDGTLLLDEISEMDLALQAKILRVLQEKEVERLGSQKIIDLNVRVLATTNRDMVEEVKANRFREDLYYRLNVFPLHWYPLRERPDDIIPLAEYLIARHMQDSGGQLPIISKAACKALREYPWPGNAREMDNVMQRALILKTADTIDVEHLHLDTHKTLQDKLLTPQKAKATKKSKSAEASETN